MKNSMANSRLQNVLQQLSRVQALAVEPFWIEADRKCTKNMWFLPISNLYFSKLTGYIKLINVSIDIFFVKTRYSIVEYLVWFFEIEIWHSQVLIVCKIVTNVFTDRLDLFQNNLLNFSTRSQSTVFLLQKIAERKLFPETFAPLQT